MATIPLSKTLRSIIRDLSETVEAIDKINGLEQAEAEAKARIEAIRKAQEQCEATALAAAQKAQQDEHAIRARLDQIQAQSAEQVNTMLAKARVESAQITASAIRERDECAAETRSLAAQVEVLTGKRDQIKHDLVGMQEAYARSQAVIAKAERISKAAAE